MARYYYHVWVRSEQYRGNEPLTYHHTSTLQPGALVEVALRKQKVLGFVTNAVKEPNFATKPITTTLNLPPLPIESLKLATWVQQFYPAPIGIVSQLFLPAALHARYTDQLTQASSTDEPAPTKSPLTAQQQQALATIQTPDTYLIHGRTGSGKTRIYIELAMRAFKNKQSALILCPEIGLTSQIAESFRRVFQNQVIVLHSQLSPKEREIAWLTILTAAQPIVVIGPRSALFSPLRNVGLIVIDEAHDQAYKQEQAPYYHATRVASELRRLHHAALVLGSATPSITDYYLAVEKHKSIIRLDQLAIPRDLERKITIVDLKDREQFSRAAHLSTPLLEAISHSISRHEQVLLYLNRRGTARVTLCNQCGWQALCPNCDLPLTYHGDSFLLRCHVCSFAQPPVTSCPVCNNTSITLRSFGTKAIVDEVQRLFPESRILRLDSDSAKADQMNLQYQNIIAGNVDILIGTQLLTKGLDLPKLGTLGIILADSSLYLPDYTAQERTYQLLTQVVGRIGRGHIHSQAIIQTYNPKSELLQSALQDDWNSFYNTELSERKRYLFPPFCHLLKLSCARATPLSAEKTATSFKSKLMDMKLAIIIEGPSSSFHEKAGGKYRWQLVIKATRRSELLKVITLLPAGWSYDLDPADLL